MKKDIYKKGLLLLCILIIVIITFVGYRLSKKEEHIEAVNKKQNMSVENNKTNESNDKNINKSVTGIVVEISGEVNNPGVYEMPLDSRINDLIDKAGGLTQNADTEYVSANINKAKKLSDEEKVYIPNKQESANEQKSNGKVTENKEQQSTNIGVGGKININTATAEELMTLKGIGESYAKRIIEYRNEHLFESIEELMNVKGIGKKRYESIKDNITI